MPALAPVERVCLLVDWEDIRTPDGVGDEVEEETEPEETGNSEGIWLEVVVMRSPSMDDSGARELVDEAVNWSVLLGLCSVTDVDPIDVVCDSCVG